MTEREWLDAEVVSTEKLMVRVLTEFDDARLTLEDAKHRLTVFIKSASQRIYDHAFTEGIKAAELDDDPTEGEFDFEIDDTGDDS